MNRFVKTIFYAECLTHIFMVNNKCVQTAQLKLKYIVVDN